MLLNKYEDLRQRKFDSINESLKVILIGALNIPNKIQFVSVNKKEIRFREREDLVEYILKKNKDLNRLEILTVTNKVIRYYELRTSEEFPVNIYAMLFSKLVADAIKFCKENPDGTK